MVVLTGATAVRHDRREQVRRGPYPQVVIKRTYIVMIAKAGVMMKEWNGTIDG